MNNSTNSRILHWLAPAGKMAKKGKKREENLRRANTARLEANDAQKKQNKAGAL
jgi:hypothetical protein